MKPGIGLSVRGGGRGVSGAGVETCPATAAVGGVGRVGGTKGGGVGLG